MKKQKLAVLGSSIALAMASGAAAGSFIAEEMKQCDAKNFKGGSRKKGGRTKWPKTNKI